MRNTKIVRAALWAALMSVGLGSAPVAADEIYRFDPSEFGDVSAVIGGAPTALGNFPAAVALLRVGSSVPLFNRQFCGGSAISDEYIVTAAHCMFDNFGTIEPSELLIAGDFVDLANDSPAEIEVAEIIVHPDYDNDAIFAENDIALVRTAIPHGLQTVQLFNGDDRKLTGVPAQVVGWGVTGFNPTTFPNLLNAATVPITDFDTCSGVYADGLGPEHICAGFDEGGVDACQGDSGGPLMISDDNENLLVGITSFGNGCALPDAFGVYSNVTHYESWINSIVPIPSSGVALFDSPEEFRADSTTIASSGGGGGGGAVDKLVLMFLLAGVWLRLMGQRVRRSIRLNNGVSGKWLGVAAVSVLLGGCAVELPFASSDSQAVSSEETSADTTGTTVGGVIAVKNEGGAEVLTVEASESHKGLPMFDGVALTEKRETVMAGVVERYGVEPTCEGKKVAPRNSRKADYYERCDLSGLEKPFDGGMITSVTYHFMSHRLVQIDASLAGHAFVLAPLADSLDKLLGESEFSTTDVGDADKAKADSHVLPQAIYHWNKAPTEALARLQTAAQADDTSFLLSIQHPRFSDSIAELPAL